MSARSATVMIRAEDRATEVLEDLCEEMAAQAFQIRVSVAILEQFAYRMGQEFGKWDSWDVWTSFANLVQVQNEYIQKLMWHRFHQGRMEQ